MRRRDGDFEVTWQAEDGYAGGARPHTFFINEDDIDEDQDEESLRKMFYEMLDEEFAQLVSPVSEDEDRFIDWAQSVIEKRREEEE